MKRIALCGSALLLSACIAYAQEPALPMGLGLEEPVLSLGLGGDEDVVANQKTDGKKPSFWMGKLPQRVSGFLEGWLGSRIKTDPTQKELSIGEGRLHLEYVKDIKDVTANLAADMVYDPIQDRYHIDLDKGEGWIDLREANILFRPTDYSDVKVGRQILTWGTGDLLFINDLFPKDWNSFFIGRDEEYLKAPSDALKLGLYHDLINMDVIYTPECDADRFIDGSRISYYSNNHQAIVGRGDPVRVDARGRWFSEDEIALRLHRLMGNYEMAAYLYDGYWKSPAGQDALRGLYIFPRLSVYGASLRGPLASGIVNAECGYYKSRDDRKGDLPLINNSEWRFLIGYEQEIMPEFTGGLQYYQEWMQDYDAYRQALPSGSPKRDEHRHLLTLRLTKQLMHQNLNLSLFTFYSPSDEDAYLRPQLSYKYDDHWTISTGGNIFIGQKRNSFFGQFEDNSNVTVAIRYGF